MSAPELANGDLRRLAKEHSIHPHRCARCKRTMPGWEIGHDDGGDRDYIGYQCEGCGQAAGLTRGTVLRRARAATGTNDWTDD